MLIDLPNSIYLFAEVNTYKDANLTLSFYLKAAGDIIFLSKKDLHEYDLGKRLIFAILKTNIKGNEKRITALFSGRSLYLLNEE